jgi:integrase
MGCEEESTMGVYKRGTIWWYNFEFQGRHVQASSGFRNKTAALRAEAKRRSELLDRRAGFTKVKVAPKLEEFVATEFLVWSKQQHRRKTYELHKLNCKTLTRFFRGCYVDEITSAMVEDFKSARKHERIQWAKNRFVAGATVNRALTTLKLLYHQAEHRGYVIKNPVDGIAMFPEPLDSMRVISFEEQAAYLTESSDPLRDIAKLILSTGMRPEEVFRMRAENLDFKQRSIFNPFGKTKAARRIIPMTDEVVSLLKGRMEKSTKLGTSYVFPSPHDIQKPIGSVKKAHSAAVKRAKIERHFRLYDLRHSFASRAAASGADLPTLSSLLGHASILMTMRYVHVAAEQKRVVMEKFEKFRAEQTCAAATVQQGVTTKVTTVELVN